MTATKHTQKGNSMLEIHTDLTVQLDEASEHYEAVDVMDTAHEIALFIKKCRRSSEKLNVNLMDKHNIYLDDMLEDLEVRFVELSNKAEGVADEIEEEQREISVSDDERSMHLGNSGVIFG